MPITREVSYNRPNGPIGRVTTKDSEVRRINGLNVSGETIAFGSLVELVDHPTDSQLSFNPAIKKVDIDTRVSFRLAFVEYNERSSNANFSDGLQYLDANGFRGLPDQVTGPCIVDGEMWVYAETPITSILDPVHVRVVDGVAPDAVQARSFTNAEVVGETLDISEAFEWMNVTSTPGPVRLRIKK